MRTIDADALSAFVGDLRSTLHKEQSTFKAMTEIEFNTRDYMLLNFQQTIDNAPTVDTTCPNCDSGYAQGYSDGYLKGKEERPIDDLSEYSDKLWQKAYERGKAERPQGRCKTCKYYHPYCEQFTNEPRGDGYCVIARMTPEGLTTINCNDEFGCSDYQEKQGAKNVF